MGYRGYDYSMGPLEESLWEDLLQVFYPEEILVAICDTFSIASKEYRITSIPKIMTTTYLRITGNLKINKKKLISVMKLIRSSMRSYLTGLCAEEIS